jgi:hypothetical protein
MESIYQIHIVISYYYPNIFYSIIILTPIEHSLSIIKIAHILLLYILSIYRLHTLIEVLLFSTSIQVKLFLFMSTFAMVIYLKLLFFIHYHQIL